MQVKFRLPDELWEQFIKKALEPSETLRGFVVGFINGEHDSLSDVMGVEEAAEQWGLSPGYIKNLCAEGKVKAKKIGKTWVIQKTQERP
ncbi:helix-turn-helix domain-containing protein [Bacillus wiedmannii]|uniref:helix-turn-helix domain-containing protein n=1 Tax=Bacillus wiedmannii TaxID=1890302 RepID=UPI000B4384DC|nr:helix-turn-helix domain-containing protein [Bacillus wiedmannii]OUB81194.1 DNA-binding protein [Bacillus thuringiensis serovar sinensis]